MVNLIQRDFLLLIIDLTVHSTTGNVKKIDNRQVDSLVEMVNRIKMIVNQRNTPNTINSKKTIGHICLLNAACPMTWPIIMIIPPNALFRLVTEVQIHKLNSMLMNSRILSSHRSSLQTNVISHARLMINAILPLAPNLGKKDEEVDRWIPRWPDKVIRIRMTAAPKK